MPSIHVPDVCTWHYRDIVLCPFKFRLRRLSGRGAETPGGPGLTHSGHSPADRLEAQAPHSITSSARESSVGGMSRPSALAVGRLMTGSNLVDCTTGRAARFAPFRRRRAYTASCRDTSDRLG